MNDLPFEVRESIYTFVYDDLGFKIRCPRHSNRCSEHKSKTQRSRSLLLTCKQLHLECLEYLLQHVDYRYGLLHPTADTLEHCDKGCLEKKFQHLESVPFARQIQNASICQFGAHRIQRFWMYELDRFFTLHEQLRHLTIELQTGSSILYDVIGKVTRGVAMRRGPSRPHVGVQLFAREESSLRSMHSIPKLLDEVYDWQVHDNFALRKSDGLQHLETYAPQLQTITIISAGKVSDISDLTAWRCYGLQYVQTHIRAGKDIDIFGAECCGHTHLFELSSESKTNAQNPHQAGCNQR